ncbi:hypothetical protein GTY51_21840 [Streptomyces sp. SID4936]|nr:hypothetical protein [Streptomyces sp. SID4936]
MSEPVEGDALPVDAFDEHQEVGVGLGQQPVAEVSRTTAKPSAVVAATTASNTWSGVLPRSAGLAATEASGPAADRAASRSRTADECC